MPEQKEDMATSVAKLQEKLERKKQRKAEKKQAKLLKLQSEPQVTTETEVLKKSQSEPAAKPEKPGKRLKVN